jgi:hypothetical protein
MSINDPIDDFYFQQKTDCNTNSAFNYYQIVNGNGNTNSPFNYYQIVNENESNIYDSPNIFQSELYFSSDNNNLFLYSSPQNNKNPPAPKKTNNFLGRKKKNSGEIGLHNKYSENNRVRKFKVIMKDALLDLINSKIKENIKLTLLIDQKEFVVDGLLNIRQDQIISTNTIDNRQLLDKTIREIFSDEIAQNFRKYPKNYNRLVIDKIYEIENGEKIIPILDMTYLDCIKYFRKDQNYMDDERFFCLKGLEKKFENLSEDLTNEGNDKKYINMLFDLIYNFENIFLKKKSRKSRKRIEYNL